MSGHRGCNLPLRVTARLWRRALSGEWGRSAGGAEVVGAGSVSER
jgi:hypothetical protein